MYVPWIIMNDSIIISKNFFIKSDHFVLPYKICLFLSARLTPSHFIFQPQPSKLSKRLNNFFFWLSDTMQIFKWILFCVFILKTLHYAQHLFNKTRSTLPECLRNRVALSTAYTIISMLFNSKNYTNNILHLLNFLPWLGHLDGIHFTTLMLI